MLLLFLGYFATYTLLVIKEFKLLLNCFIFTYFLEVLVAIGLDCSLPSQFIDYIALIVVFLELIDD